MDSKDITCFGLINWGWDVIGKTEMGYMDKTFEALKAKYTQKEFNKNIRAIYTEKNNLAKAYSRGYITANDVLVNLGNCQIHAGVK